MSLFTRAPHQVLVQNREMQRDREGARMYVPVGPRIPVRCLAEPVREWSTAEEAQALGMQVVDLLVLRCREWPGTIDSHVYFNGQVYETVGVPQEFGLSRRTHHWRVTVRWIGKEDAGG